MSSSGFDDQTARADIVVAGQITANFFQHSAGTNLLLVEPPSSDFHHSV